MIWRISLLFILLASKAAAVDCRNLKFEGASYTVCAANVATNTIRTFLYGSSKAPYGAFAALPGRIKFAMNAGMYHPERNPVGLYIENGKTLRGLVKGASRGNFGLVPNGVFCVQPDRVDVIETLAFAKDTPNCTFASQSGPMLVIDGKLHPRFRKTSTSLNIRNGVGTTADGDRVFFAISNDLVNFHSFARLFRDVLKLPNALYFDGRVSRMYAPQLDRHDMGMPMGPIVAITD